MIVMTGATGYKPYLKKMESLGIGRMLVTQMVKLYPNEKWGLDNGAFAAWKNNYEWNQDKYLTMLNKAEKLNKPYLAVIPDKPTKPDSLEYSMKWLDKLPVDYNWYLCLQDGMDIQEVEDACSDVRIKGLFLGGTHEFKQRALEFIRVARNTNKLFHYARTSSIKAVLHAYDLGCDSCDSNYFLWESTRMKALFNLLENDFKTTQLRMINSYVISMDTIDKKLIAQI